jgi:hypothetical protein
MLKHAKGAYDQEANWQGAQKWSTQGKGCMSKGRWPGGVIIDSPFTSRWVALGQYNGDLPPKHMFHLIAKLMA